MIGRERIVGMKREYLTYVLSMALVSVVVLSGMVYGPPSFSSRHSVLQGIDNVAINPEDATKSLIPFFLIVVTTIFSVGYTTFKILRSRQTEPNLERGALKELKIPILLGIMLVAFLIRLYFLSIESLQSDESIYIYTAYLVAKGFIPYRDVFMAHTPLSINIQALFIKLIGTSYLSYRILNLSLFLITMPLVYWLANILLAGKKEVYALVAVGLYAFYPSWFITVSFTSSMENLLAIFTLSAAITYMLFHKEGLTRHLILTGFFSGCALITTLRAVYFLAPLFIFHIGYIIWTRRIIRIFKDGLSSSRAL